MVVNVIMRNYSILHIYVNILYVLLFLFSIILKLQQSYNIFLRYARKDIADEVSQT